MANVSDVPQDINLVFDGLKKKQTVKQLAVVTYHSDDPDADNTLDEAEKIVPQKKEVSAEGQSFELTIAPKTFAVYIFSKTGSR